MKGLIKVMKGIAGEDGNEKGSEGVNFALDFL